MKKIVENRNYIMKDKVVTVLKRTKKHIQIGSPEDKTSWGYLYIKAVDNIETATLNGKVLFDAMSAVKAKGELAKTYTIAKARDRYTSDEYEGTFEGLREHFTTTLQHGSNVTRLPKTIDTLIANLNKTVQTGDSTNVIYSLCFELEQGIG